MKILLPVDGSAISNHAVEEFVKVAQGWTDLDVYLLTVIIPLPAGMYITVDPSTEEHLAAEEQQAYARQLLDQAGIPYHYQIEVSRHPARHIVAYAKKIQCDRIVLGGGQLGLFKGLMFGDTLAYIIHHAAAPVEVIPLAGHL